MEINHRAVNKKLDQSKIILSSFPTWSITAPDFQKQETWEEKLAARTKNKDLDFFFGSFNNKFWNWYKNHVDSSVDKQDIPGIQYSLERHQIGITDIILECQRLNKSSLDANLKKRRYNDSFFNKPAVDQTVKILCTSKGLLNQMLLRPFFFKKNKGFQTNTELSEKFESCFLKSVNGEKEFIKKPFYRFIECEERGTIECLAIPSPGSPYRDLKHFGFKGDDSNLFLKNYLTESFKWFLK